MAKSANADKLIANENKLLDAVKEGRQNVPE